MTTSTCTKRWEALDLGARKTEIEAAEGGKGSKMSSRLFVMRENAGQLKGRIGDPEVPKGDGKKVEETMFARGGERDSLEERLRKTGKTKKGWGAIHGHRKR